METPRRAKKKSMLAPSTRPKSGARKAAPPETDTWMRREASADLLGVSVNTILNFERRGWLHPRRVICADSGRLVWLYDPKELATITQRNRISTTRDPGETAARAFELFSTGRPLPEVVMALREPPAKVHELHESYLDMGGANFTITSGAKEALEKMLGPFANVTEMIERIGERLKAA